jgi:predicted alpha-1,2-mannosidase
MSLLADSLGHRDDAALLRRRAQGWRNYYDPVYGTLRPKLSDGSFYSPFDPAQGMDFAPNPGFHEGCAWNYTFYVPHDVAGLCSLMGGRRRFVERLESVFDKGYYDPANEPDISYPYLFSYFPGEEWRTQRRVAQLLDRYFTAAPDGIPGNDDAGAMSAWALFSMMGFYPDCPGKPEYTLTTPVFDRVEITLDRRYYPSGLLTIVAPRRAGNNIYTNKVTIDRKQLTGRRIDHRRLTSCGTLEFTTSSEKP